MKPKKIVVLLLMLCLTLVGCQKNESSYKKEAIQAYVDNSNMLMDVKTLKMDVKGNLNVPKSISISEEVNSSIEGSLLVDPANLQIGGEFTIKANKENMDMALYFSDNYVYFKIDGKCMKVKNTNDLKNEATKSEKISVESFSKQLDSLKDVQFKKETRNGVEGYIIAYTATLDELLKELSKQDANLDIKELEMLKALTVEVEIFSPAKATGEMAYNMKMNIQLAIVNIDINPLEITMKPSDEKITIPEDAKKAIEVDENTFGTSLIGA